MIEQSAPSFRARLIGVIALFIVLSGTYAVLLPRNMDEFGTANSALMLRHAVPYRDFCPPKTLLSYYFQLPMLLTLSDAWNALTSVRLLTLLMMSAVLTMAALSLRRIVSDTSLLLALLMLVLMSNFAERSFEVRADGLSAAFALLSLVALLRERPFAAGVLAALSFLSTQKGIYFVFAGGAVVTAALLFERSRGSVARWLRYMIGGATTGAIYFLIWAVAASPSRVLGCIFGNSNIAVAFTPVYDVRAKYWLQAIGRNPIFFALAAVGIVLLSIRWLRRDVDAPQMIVTPYAIALITCALWHKQPWPYFFVNIAPTLFVVIAITFDLLRPLRMWRVVLILALAGGVAFPLLRLRSTLTHTAAFQEATFRVAEQLAGPHGKYVDGVGYLYRNKQPSNALAWVEAAQALNLATFSPQQLANVLHEVDAAPTKLLMWNYRMQSLPEPLRVALRARFAPLYGNIFMYAPTLRPGRFWLSFAGTYRVADAMAAALIDGQSVNDEQNLQLAAGWHTLTGNPLRLRLLPPPDMQADPDFIRFQDPYAYLYDY